MVVLVAGGGPCSGILQKQLLALLDALKLCSWYLHRGTNLLHLRLEDLEPFGSSGNHQPLTPAAAAGDGFWWRSKVGLISLI